MPSLKVLLTSGFPKKQQQETLKKQNSNIPFTNSILKKPYTQQELASAVLAAMNRTE